jgi:hypothetical protein
LFNLSQSKTFNFFLVNRNKNFLSGEILRDYLIVLVQLCYDFIRELVNRFMGLARAGQGTSLRHKVHIEIDPESEHSLRYACVEAAVDSL